MHEQFSPRLVELESSEYSAVCGWPFTDSYVTRMLESDLPHRVTWSKGRIWVYSDVANEIVGFGSIDYCEDYGYLTEGKRHAYIPLLAVHPDQQRKGYGAAIVTHLVEEAATSLSGSFDFLCGFLFLDVYQSNVGAIELYKRSQFEIVGEDFDEKEQQPYFIMARNVGVSF